MMLSSHSGGGARTVESSSRNLTGPSSTPVPLAPYTPHPQIMPPPPGSQGQLVCNGCRTLLLYPHGASNVQCAVCNTVTTVPPQGTEMAQLICGGCRTLLMYMRGASSVQCSCCRTVNLAMEANQFAHVNCGGCGTMLMYPYGAHCVRCAVCQFVSSTGQVNPMRMPAPTHGPAYASTQLPASLPQPSWMQTQAQTQTQTVVVENPMTLDESGKLVSNVAVGVTTEKK